MGGNGSQCGLRGIENTFFFFRNIFLLLSIQCSLSHHLPLKFCQKKKNLKMSFWKIKTDSTFFGQQSHSASRTVARICGLSTRRDPWAWPTAVGESRSPKGDISGFERDSLFRSKGGGCRREWAWGCDGWKGSDLLNCLSGKIYFETWNESSQTAAGKERFEESIQNHAKTSKSGILGRFLRNVRRAHTFSKILLLNDYVPKWTALLCTQTSLREWQRENF